MSLQLAAQHLAAQGRGPDKQLVHMSPREVAGLQALAMAHGGSLTTNPDTGLPEAGFLDNLLPAIIGAGLAFATGGTSLAATGGMFGLGMPATIGLGIGALETARTGNLQKGLMAGLGAYGGAGLFTGLAGSAAAGPGMAVTNPAAPQMAMEQAAQAGAQAGGIGSIVPEAAQTAQAAQAGVTGAGATPTMVSYNPLSEHFVRASEGTLGSGTFGLDDFAKIEGFPSASGPSVNPAVAARQAQAAQLGVIEIPPPAGPSIPITTQARPFTFPTSAPTTGISTLGDLAPYEIPATERITGFGNVGDMPAYTLPERTLADKSFAERFSAMPGKDLAKYGLAAAAPVLLAPPEFKQPELDREQARYAYSPGPMMPPTRMGDVGEYTYFRPQYTRLAAGGPVEAMSAANVYDMQNARGGVSDMGIDNSTGMQKMARGGISDLGDYSDGGRLLKGPGDGVSDSIPAMIGRKQPARLADNEFVIPARIVSEIGNGSTDAGARKLYQMMDRIQQRRAKTVGKGKVAVDSKAYKEVDRL